MSSQKKPPAHEPSHAHDHESTLGIPDEIVHVPEKRNRLVYLFFLAALILMIAFFTVGDSIVTLAKGWGASAPVFTWTPPGKSEVAVSGTDLYETMRALDHVASIDPFLGIQLGFQAREIKPEQGIRFLVLQELAEGAGLHVTTADLAAHLAPIVQQLPGGRATYESFAIQAGGVRPFESIYSRALLVARFLQIVGAIGSLPSAEAIEEMWAANHVEYAFDYVQVDVEGLEEAARAGLPSDGDLGAWYDALDTLGKFPFLAPEQRRAEVAYFMGAEGMGAEGVGQGLLAAYPAPADADPIDRANTYYNRVFDVRFAKPVEPPANGAEDDPAPGDPAQGPQFLSFDEVKERCLAEGPLFLAMEDWLASLQKRRADGETIDLAAEAAAMGLRYLVTESALDREAFETLSEFGDARLSDRVFQTLPESFAPGVLFNPKVVGVLRVLERIEPAPKPLALVRDEVAQAWVEERAKELALEKVTALRDAFPELPPDPPKEGEDEALEDDGEELVRRSADEEAFRTAVEAAGSSVQRRDWFDKGLKPFMDPAYTLPVAGFLRPRMQALQEAKDGELSEAALDASGEHAFLARKVGERPVPIERLSPLEYERYRSSIAQSGGGFGAGTEEFSIDFLTRAYGLVITRSDAAADDEPPAN